MNAEMTGRQQDVANSHQPKGGMCMACVWAKRDCGSLDFKSMPVIGKDDSTGAKIVRCTEYLGAAHKEKPVSSRDGL